MKARRTVRIVNETGLHARPCHAIVTAALDFEADLRIRCGDNEVNGKSILALMTLEAHRGQELVLSTAGHDAERLLDRLEALISGGFEESP